jgi:membrane AbrB-like protein
MSTAPGRFLPLATTLGAALVGGGVFSALGLPVAWLSGSMVFVAGLALAGVPLALPLPFRDLGFLLAGVAMGSTVTSEALGLIARYPFSVFGLLLSVVVSIVLATLLLQRSFGWDRPTAFLASVPGALSAVMAVAAESSADVRRVAMVQLMRLVVLVVVLPYAIGGMGKAAAVVRSDMAGPWEFAALFAAAIALTEAFRRMNMANPMFLGAMLASTLLHVTEIIPGQVPDIIMLMGSLLVGAFCGHRFVGTTPAMILSTLAPSLAVLAIVLAVAAGCGVLVHWVTQLPLGAVLVAFAPGGLEAMVLMGAALGLDTLYISTHHVLRAVGLMLVMPLIAPRGESAAPKAERS